jgi:hypothetical protein
MVFPALGLEWMSERLKRRGLRWVGNLATCVVLSVASLWGGYDYFVRHGLGWTGKVIDGAVLFITSMWQGDDGLASAELAYWFEQDQVQEAIEINRFLGTGWQGEGISEALASQQATRSRDDMCTSVRGCGKID